jgi:tight adherence protein C
MSTDLIFVVVGAFVSVALLAGWATSSVLAAQAPGRRRLRDLAQASGADLAAGGFSLVEAIDSPFKKIPGVVPSSAKSLGRLRKRLAMAGYHSTQAVVVFGLASLLTPIVFGLIALAVFGYRAGLIGVAFAAVIGYLLPGVLLARKITKRKLEIQNGLPDALDLLIVCVEAGSGIDQAVAKVTEELQIAYPALSYELRLVGTEIRAGKSRTDAFKSFATRTKVDDVQSLVALLVQTDKFGTSIAQALRTHAETSRTKRRQRAEERAGKVGVKLVFPLVLFLFPALYIVILGPAAIQFLRVFRPMAGGQ